MVLLKTHFPPFQPILMPPEFSVVHEVAFVKSFMVSRKRDRFLGFIRNPKKRAEITRRFYHQHDMEPDCIHELGHFGVDIESDLERSVALVLGRLVALGSPSVVHLLSANKTIDGLNLATEHGIAQALSHDATVVSCIPGKLAFLTGEDQSFRAILQSRPTGA